MSHLTKMIEANRKKMIELSKIYGICSIEVVECSQELDMLLNLLMNEKGFENTNNCSYALKNTLLRERDSIISKQL
jgi:hypothetical protein